MFSFLKSKNKEQKTENEPIKAEEHSPKKSWLGRLGSGLKKTRHKISNGLANAILGKKVIDEALLEALETLLLSADLGIETTDILIQKLTDRVSRKELFDPAALADSLKKEMVLQLTPYESTLQTNQPLTVILMVGVNGAGKTTSIAKITHFYQSQGKKVMLAAGDTFRAAAVEQLQTWGERNNVPVIAQQHGADSASVIYDAMQSASAKNYDVLIADTAGRLHTQGHLMNELKKIKRVIQKFDPDAPHDTMLIVDATIGQNALVQAVEFHEAIGLSSISITKLDGTAKGGMLFAITEKMKLPIRYIGVGEKITDLKPFKAEEFVEALFEEKENEQTELQ